MKTQRSTKLHTGRAAILSTVCAAVLATGATPALAQPIDTNLYDGGKARVNRALGLRGLSETIASASCRYNAGIDLETAEYDLQHVHDSFDAILKGLEFGDRALGMPGEESAPRILKAIQQTHEIWDPMEHAALAMLDGSATDADVAIISEGYHALFDQTTNLAADVSGEYTNPQELLQSDATVLNFAGRQRALAERMTRAVCELATGVHAETALSELIATVDMFELTLVALRDGYEAAGVNPPPNDTVKSSLESTYEIWQAGRGIYDAIKSGQPATPEDVIASNTLTQQLTVGMNNAITLYLIATPGKDGIYRVPLEAYADAELSTWASDPMVIAAVNAQNAKHANISEDEIIALDQQWRAEASGDGGPLMTAALDNDLSEWLRQHQAETAGFVTEVFIMDHVGLNVAQSVPTSDFWQGDEAKHQETYHVGPDALHISDIEFDDSTGFYQAQASLSIVDPATNQVIGAMTFGINVQSLM
ncbi:type IV pili methyl-accepting chemotaxis transducer N-terminal domain-containing protein [Loktanella sp. S4079]|uniref:type IV pili methyl-accepting chemotaxis transducer N-terminal domain-containing protein n=1 Tax=Loktanella sp. S4079 TaxID=579483 RepID=UPI000A04AAF6|nr:type IV pili methyl-accepting chemotaxis transducer N-terminal domain-containing protein [Loktanella sp. S4079]